MQLVLSFPVFSHPFKREREREREREKEIILRSWFIVHCCSYRVCGFNAGSLFLWCGTQYSVVSSFAII